MVMVSIYIYIIVGHFGCKLNDNSGRNLHTVIDSEDEDIKIQVLTNPRRCAKFISAFGKRE
jgi:hypothetical protein